MPRLASLASLAVVLGLTSAGCVIPPAPVSLPASGVAGQRRADMSAPRVKGENPFQDAYWVIDGDSNARHTAAEWRATRPADAAALDKIAGQPAAGWMGNWFPQIENAVKTYVWSRTRGGGLPVMILYNLPFRDCGGYSAGGAGSAAGYRKWIDNVAAGVGSKRAVFVLEPDGLPLMTKCLKPDKQAERVAMIHYAVEKLESLPGAAVYIDAGHSAWVPAAVMAPRLKAAGIDLADGFSLNVANYQATPDLLKYGHALSALLGGKLFIIDTGRNGNGPPPGVSGDDERAWCNPDGRARERLELLDGVADHGHPLGLLLGVQALGHEG
jgi:endoglucanase